jgi:hypothetical protein
MAKKRVRCVVASIPAACAVALAILVGFSSRRNREGLNKAHPEPRSQPEMQPDRLHGQEMQDDSSVGPAIGARRGCLLLPPQWLVFLILAAALAIIGFGNLPPETQDLSNELSATIDISVNRPGVQLLAVLDGSQASSGALFVELYAEGVPGGFRWRITSSNDLSTDDSVPDQGRLTDQVTGNVAGSNSALYFILTDPSITPDLQAALTGNAPPSPTVTRGVREDTSDYSWPGSNLQVKLPTLEFYGSRTSKSPTGWHAPTGRVVILGPSEIQTFQTDIFDPAYSSPGMWEGTSQIVAPYWSGTDLAIQSQENRNLFIAGLLFGIAGAATIGCFQDVAIRYRSWRDKQDHDHP